MSFLKGKVAQRAAVGLSASALVIAFVLLASYTYTSVLRPPALIAFVKDTLIYLTIIAALFAVTSKFGGWHGIFSKAAEVLATRPKPAARAISGACRVTLVDPPMAIATITALRSESRRTISRGVKFLAIMLAR